MNVQLSRAIQAGEIVHIAEVGRGLKCGCVCPNCGAALIAKQGKTNQWSFAHHKAPECDLVTAAETALHLAAKKIIGERQRLRIPPNEIAVSLSDRSGHQLTRSRVIPAQVVDFDQVDQEVAIGPYRADIIAWTGIRKLVVEIKVSHAVDDDKKDFLRKHKISCIELDISKLDRNISNDELASLLTESGVSSQWIFNSRAVQIRIELTKQLQSEINARNEAIIKENSAAERARGAQLKRVSAISKELTDYLNTGTLPSYDSSFRISKSRAHTLTGLFGYSLDELPTYIQIPIADERAFACESWIWQGWIFHKWLRCPSPEDAIGKQFRAIWVAHWANKHLPIPKCIKILKFPKNQRFVSHGFHVPNPYEAIRSYLKELSSLGFLVKDQVDGYVVERNDLFERQ